LALSQSGGAEGGGPADAMLLAERLAIRLCHDISGPLGTLMGSLELVGEDPGVAAEALPLASDVSAALAQRLRLMRAAWGNAAGAMDMAAFRAMAAQPASGRKVDFILDVADQAARFSPTAARLALNLLMLAQESLPHGGQVRFAGDPRGDMVVTIAGPRAAWPAGFAGYLAAEPRAWAALRGGGDTDAARGIQALLTALIAHRSGLKLSFLMGASTDAPPLLMHLSGG
jgi:histidine phosphotransferase ChpT